MRLGQISFVSFLSQVLASVIGFVATVLITRVLGADVFGTYALIVAVVIWLKTIAIMGVRSALVKRLSEEGDTGEYVVAAALVLAAILAVLSGVLFAASGTIDAYVGRSVTAVIVALTWASAALAFTSGILQGRHLVHYATALKPLEIGVRSVVQIAVVLASGGLLGLLSGFGVGGLLAAAVGLLVVSIVPRRPSRRHFRELFEFGRFGWLGRLSNRTFTSIDTVVLGIFVSVGLIGIYEVAWNLASILAIFGTAIGQTLFPEISRVASRGDLAEVSHLLERGVAYAGLFLIPGLVGSLVVGDLVLLVYGSAFPRGHIVLVLLVGSRLLYAYADQLLTALNGLDRPDLAFRVNATFVAANLGLNLLLVWQFGWTGAAVATVVSAGLALGLSMRSAWRLVGGFDVPTRELGSQTLAAAAMGAAVFAVRGLLADSLLLGVGLVGFGAAVYVLLLLGISPQFRRTVADNVPV